MENTLKVALELANTPLPTILVVGGLLFLFLGIVKKFGTTIILNPKKQTLSMEFGIALLILGTVLYSARQDISLQNDLLKLQTPPLTLTREFLISHSWEFLHAEGDVISPQIRLDPSGTIRGLDHPNESRWGMEGGKLVFYHVSGVPSTRFYEMRYEDGKIVLSGRLLLPGHQAIVIHVLKEL